jgi:hypothetical protein
MQYAKCRVMVDDPPVCGYEISAKNLMHHQRFIDKAVAGVLALGILAGPSLDAASTQELGKFGNWALSRGRAANGMPTCTMLQIVHDGSEPSFAFLLTEATSETMVVLLMRPMGGLGGLRKGETFSVTSTVRGEYGEKRFNSPYTVLDNGFVAAGSAPTRDFRKLVGELRQAQTWFWQLDAPAARITKLRVPFEGFISAADALMACGRSIGVSF